MDDRENLRLADHLKAPRSAWHGTAASLDPHKGSFLGEAHRPKGLLPTLATPGGWLPAPTALDTGVPATVPTGSVTGCHGTAA